MKYPAIKPVVTKEIALRAKIRPTTTTYNPISLWYNIGTATK